MLERVEQLEREMERLREKREDESERVQTEADEKPKRENPVVADAPETPEEAAREESREEAMEAEMARRQAELEERERRLAEGEKALTERTREVESREKAVAEREKAQEERSNVAEGGEREARTEGAAETTAETQSAWKAMEERLERLRTLLEDSAYKDNLIKELHKELQQHRQGMLADVAKPYLRSLMKIHERLWDTAHYYAREEVRKEADAYARFLRKVESDVVAVQDMLEDDFGVSYFQAEAGGEFRPKEHHALKTVATTDAALSGRVAECLYGGFRMEETGKVVKAAQITLYKMDNANK